MFNRDIVDRLNEWASKKDRKPLVLRGARQVGKTSAVNIFAQSFDHYIYLNLDLAEDKQLFELDSPFKDLVAAIFFSKNKELNAGRTLLFIDEIQNSPSAVSKLRYFYENASDIYVIAAGSLLESLIDKTISFPVGRVEFLAVRPCNFREFLLAIGETESAKIINNYPAAGYAHDKLINLFAKYMLIGGMPEVVKSYAEYGDLVKLSNIYESLIVSYLDDVEKYSKNSNQTNIIRHIISSAFLYAGERIKFEGFGKSGYRSRDIGESFRILEKTMLLQLVYPVTATSFPIEANLAKSPKLHLLDTGLVNYKAKIQGELLKSNKIDNVYQGKIAEHIVGQELMALNQSVLGKINFWTREDRKTNAEVDFIYQFRNLVIPIEVKSGASGSLRSLHSFIDKAPHGFAVRVWSGKAGVEETTTLTNKPFKLISIPFYLIRSLDSILEYYRVGE